VVDHKLLNRQYEKVLNSIADGVFTIDRDSNITFFNRAAEKITGMSRDQAVGQKCFEVFRANICQTSCALQKTIKTGKELINLYINILNSEGRAIPISVSTSVLRDENGDCGGCGDLQGPIHYRDAAQRDPESVHL